MPKNLSKECKEVIAGMITVDPKKRMTPREFLQSDWVKNSD